MNNLNLFVHSIIIFYKISFRAYIVTNKKINILIFQFEMNEICVFFTKSRDLLL